MAQIMRVYGWYFCAYFILSCIGDKTDNLIGISETLVSTSAAGIFFALLSGQPLIIIGATGPLLLFDESLYSVSLNCLFFKYCSHLCILRQPCTRAGKVTNHIACTRFEVIMSVTLTI